MAVKKVKVEEEVTVAAPKAKVSKVDADLGRADLNQLRDTLNALIDIVCE